MIKKILQTFQILKYNSDYLNTGIGPYKLMFKWETLFRFILPPFITTFFSTVYRVIRSRLTKQTSSGLSYILTQVKIKEISFCYSTYDNLEQLIKKDGFIEHDKIYLWEDLLKSVKAYGVIRPIQIEYIPEATKKMNLHAPYKDFKYMIEDGNHRLMILKHLYGKEALIKVYLRQSNNTQKGISTPYGDALNK